MCGGGGLTWTIRGLSGAAFRAAAATAPGERAPSCGETQQKQQAAEPGEPEHRSHDGRIEGGERRDPLKDEWEGLREKKNWF